MTSPKVILFSICNVVRWLDQSQDFSISVQFFRDNRAHVFDAQVRPVIEEQILGHLTERDILSLVRFFSILRGYNENVISWLAKVALRSKVVNKQLEEVLARSIQDTLGTLRVLNGTRLSSMKNMIYRFDSMTRQLVSLQVEFGNPDLFWEVNRWAAEMYDSLIEGVNQAGKLLPTHKRPQDVTQAQYMAESLFHHAQLMRYQQSQSDAAQNLTQCVQRYCGQARSTAGWTGQLIELFVDFVLADEELKNLLQMTVGADCRDTVLRPAYDVIG